MREQLAQYVTLLFAGTQNCEDIKQEILQNSLDRYDDLIAQGKAPEAAYRLAIMGIGDISEILGAQSASAAQTSSAKDVSNSTVKQSRNRAVAIGLYIVCMIPVIVLSEFGLDILGLCLTLVIVAAATVLLLTNEKSSTQNRQAMENTVLTPQQELKKSVCRIIRVICLIAYFIISFTTGAWYVTWLIFPLSGAIQGLAKAILDLKETIDYEK